MKINKENAIEFLNIYHYLHDAVLMNINYNVKEANLDMDIKVLWKGTPKLKSDNTYECANKILRLKFLDVEKLRLIEWFSYDYIGEATLSFVTIDNKEYIKFEDKDNNILVIAEELEYEEETYD